MTTNSNSQPAKLARKRRAAAQGKNHIKERRKMPLERRGNESIAQFPIITTQGICVRRDRRKIPDRRMSNIVVRQSYVKEDVFETLFGNYLEYKERRRRMQLKAKAAANNSDNK